jgi:hypothetical protein
MSDETRIPAQRDLPPGRLQRRKEHLVAEVSMWDREAKRRRRRLALVLVPVVLAVLAVTGFTTYALTREPTHLESIGCFETAELDGSIAVVNADGRNPTAICAKLWRKGDMGLGPAPESLAACVLETGAVGVFPSSGKDTCNTSDSPTFPRRTRRRRSASPLFATRSPWSSVPRTEVRSVLRNAYGRRRPARSFATSSPPAGTRTGASRSSGTGSPRGVRAPRWAWGSTASGRSSSSSPSRTSSGRLRRARALRPFRAPDVRRGQRRRIAVQEDAEARTMASREQRR